jgi:hypothetical protein
LYVYLPQNSAILAVLSLAALAYAAGQRALQPATIADAG